MIALLLLGCAFGVFAEDSSSKAQSKIDTFLTPPLDNTLFFKHPQFHQPKEEPSFISKVTNWIFSFGGTSEKPPDPVPSETQHRYAPQYLPPPPYADKSCNPCNKEPWIPVVGTHGHNTLISFMPPSHLQSGVPISNYHNIPPAAPHSQISFQYGPPRPPPPLDQQGYPTNVKPVLGYPPEGFKPPPPPPKQRTPLKFEGFQFKGQNVAPQPQPKPGAPKVWIPKIKLTPPPPQGPSTYYDQTSVNQPRLPPNPVILKSYVLPVDLQPPHINAAVGNYNFLAINQNQSSQTPPNIVSHILTQQPVNNNNNNHLSHLPINYDASSSGIEQNLLSSPGSNYQVVHYVDPKLTIFNKPALSSKPNPPSFPLNSFPVQNIRGKQKNVYSDADVQIIPSIRVADYLASIEHPINVIRSPLVEVITADKTESGDENGNSYGDSNNPLKNHDTADVFSEDNHAAATVQNASYHNPKQNESYFNSIPSQDRNVTSFAAVASNLPEANFYTTERSKVAEAPQTTANTNFNHLEDYTHNSPLISPSLDYSNWLPSFKVPETSMVPPAAEQTSFGFTSSIPPTTQKVKQVQIIIPYITNKAPPANTSINTRPFSEYQQNNPLSTTLPVYTQPPSVAEPVWSRYVTEVDQVTTIVPEYKTKTYPSNIRDLLYSEKQDPSSFKTSSLDILRLQKNIDDWTEQEFSNSIVNFQKSSTSGKLVPSKNIPSAYLTTQTYSKPSAETSTEDFISATFSDYKTGVLLGSASQNENSIDYNFVTDTIPTHPTTELASTSNVTSIETTNETISYQGVTSTNSSEVNASKVVLPAGALRPFWDKLQLAVSPLTKEKVYVVTPQPWQFAAREINEKLLAVTASPSESSTSAKFSVVVQSGGSRQAAEHARNLTDKLHIVYSEWPHLINNLAVQAAADKAKISRNPLFGLMDLSYVLPLNSSVKTYGGHSKVTTVVTPASTTEKENASVPENKAVTEKVGS